MCILIYHFKIIAHQFILNYFCETIFSLTVPLTFVWFWHLYLNFFLIGIDTRETLNCWVPCTLSLYVLYNVNAQCTVHTLTNRNPLKPQTIRNYTLLPDLKRIICPIVRYCIVYRTCLPIPNFHSWCTTE
jgi:hypothetical protein